MLVMHELKLVKSVVDAPSVPIMHAIANIMHARVIIILRYTFYITAGAVAPGSCSHALERDAMKPGIWLQRDWNAVITFVPPLEHRVIIFVIIGTKTDSTLVKPNPPRMHAIKPTIKVIMVIMVYK